VVLLGAVLLVSPATRACDDTARSWAAGCSAIQGVIVAPERCMPDRLVVVATAPGGAPLRVEIDRDASRGLVHAGQFGASPVGEFADWSAEPASTHRAFDAVVACALPGIPDTAFAPPSPVPARVSWSLAGAVLALLSLCAAMFRRPSRRALATAARLVGLTAFTWLARRAFFPASFFHPNGQGPLWIGYALGQESSYGPGFRELFGLVVDGAADPDRALIAAQSAASALIPILAWATARASGGSRLFAWALAVVLALDPAAGRAARSEAYYATLATLLFASSFALALATRALRVRSFAFVAGGVAAGLFAAAAVRVHPIGWAAAAMIPLGALAARGRGRRRVGVGVAGGALFTVVLMAAAGAEVLGVLRGPLGHQYGAGMNTLGPGVRSGGLVLAVLVAAARRSSALSRALVVVTILLAAIGTNLLGPATPWVYRAYLLLFVPAATGGLAVLLSPRLVSPAWRAVPVGLAFAACLGSDLIAARNLTAHTTDEAEAAFALRWRATLPRGAVVDYLSSAGRRVVFLPLYEGTSGDVHPRRRSADEPVQCAGSGNRPTYYYASSLCSTPEGQAFCAEVERRSSLHEVASAELPAQESMPGLGFEHAPVRVALYRCEGTP
jgi:hypothetical protein